MADTPVLDMSQGRQQNHDVLSFVEFECPTCHQMEKGNRGYFVEHFVTVKNAYGLYDEHMCPSSNTKIKAELRTLKLEGSCEGCGSNIVHELTEDFPGGLPIEAGYMKIPCVNCNGLTEAICTHCGGRIMQTPAGTWAHPTSATEFVEECPNQLLTDGDDTEDEEVDDELDSEFFTPAAKQPNRGEPLPGTIRNNEFHTVFVTDQFTITPSEDSEEEPHQDQEV